MLIKKIVWFRQLMAELGFTKFTKHPTEAYGDNVQANRLCKEHFVSPGNQYIAVQYHFNKEKVESGDVTIHWVNTVNNVADIFTKALCTETFVGLKKFLLCNG